MRRYSPAGREPQSPCAGWRRPAAAAPCRTPAPALRHRGRDSPRGAEIVSRSLPLTWTASVTWSSTSSAASKLGHSASATSPSPPSACPAFLGEVRRHRRDQPDQAPHRLGAGRRRLGLLDRRNQFVQLRHRLVELQRPRSPRRWRRWSGAACASAPSSSPSPPASGAASRHTRWTKRAAPSIPPIDHSRSRSGGLSDSMNQRTASAPYLATIGSGSTVLRFDLDIFSTRPSSTGRPLSTCTQSSPSRRTSSGLSQLPSPAR